MAVSARQRRSRQEDTAPRLLRPILHVLSTPCPAAQPRLLFLDGVVRARPRPVRAIETLGMASRRPAETDPLCWWAGGGARGSAALPWWSGGTPSRLGSALAAELRTNYFLVWSALCLSIGPSVCLGRGHVVSFDTNIPSILSIPYSVQAATQVLLCPVRLGAVQQQVPVLLPCTAQGRSTGQKPPRILMHGARQTAVSPLKPRNQQTVAQPQTLAGSPATHTILLELEKTTRGLRRTTQRCRRRTEQQRRAGFGVCTEYIERIPRQLPLAPRA